MLKVWTVAIPIEIIIIFSRFFAYLFSLNSYDLLTGYTCTHVPVHTPTGYIQLKTRFVWQLQV